MIVSSATVVLPVWRSPMINSRWPRPMGTMRVDRFDAGLQRLFHRLTVNHARRQPFQRLEVRRGNRPFAVDRLAREH